MISLRTLFVAPVWGVGAAALWIIGSLVGPDVETKLFPVLSDQVVGDAWRAHGLACFRWTYSKRRDPEMIEQGFLIERPDGIRYPVKEWRPDLGTGSNASTVARPGERRTIPECVVIPPALRDAPRFTVLGHKIYQPFPRPWKLDEPLIPVRFDAQTPTTWPANEPMNLPSSDANATP